MEGKASSKYEGLEEERTRALRGSMEDVLPAEDREVEEGQDEGDERGDGGARL